MEKHIKLALLLDLYGNLLTERQRSVMELYLNEDLTITEIAAESAISRQAVFDLIHRSEKILTDYDDKLGLSERYYDLTFGFDKIYDYLLSLPNPDPEILSLARSIKETL
jgi:predicted DNA-binding protein YlxM (UPF0122 family)